MRVIKFRAWNNNQMSHPFTLGEAVSWPDGKVSTANKIGIVMQFTGLTDANGVEIYEGDILKVTSSIKSEFIIVGIWMGNACFMFEGQETGNPIYPNLINMRKEVIGNIHQNPELLESNNV